MVCFPREKIGILRNSVNFIIEVINMMVYADNAATTCVSKAALDAMMPYLTTYYGNPSSLYAFAQDAKEALENARETVAKLIGAASPREIYFTSGGS